MDQQNSRSWFVDSRHCTERPDGGFELNLYENVELSDQHACYVDDISITGTMPNVSSNNRLYLYEWTPSSFNFTGTCQAHTHSDLGRNNGTALFVDSHTPDATRVGE